MNNELIAVLKQISLFKDLKEADIIEIANQFEEEHFPANAIVLREGDYGDKVYFILEGILDVYVLDKKGEDKIIASISKGNYFGELALLIDGFRNNSVRTKTICKLLSLTKNKFANILANNVTVSYALNKVLSRRLGETLHLISAKNDNTKILMILSSEAEARAKHFEEYLKILTLQPVVSVEGSISQNDFITLQSQSSNHFFLIKCYNRPNDFLRQQAQHIINFVEEDQECFCLTSQATIWKIEHTVRKILHKTVGLALCSGGAPGAAQLGVLKVLQAENIPIDYIVGTSIGAVIGGSYAFSHPIESVVKKFLDLSQQSILMSLTTLIKNISFNFSGILKNTFYREVFTSVFGNDNFEDAHIPFAAVASDLYSGETVVLKTGNVVNAIIASNTAPVLFEPYRQHEKLLIDGVATNPLPVDVLIQEGIDIKIAVPIPQLNLNVSMTKKSKLIAIFVRSRSMMAEQITQSSSELADVIINPSVEGINMNDWRNLNNIIEVGEHAARLALKRIRYLLYGSKQRDI